MLGNGTWGSVDAILTYKTKAEYDTAVANNEIPDGAKVIKEYDDEEGGASVIDIDAAMSDTSVNPVQNKVIKKYIDDLHSGLTEIELLQDIIEGISVKSAQCFVKDGIAYVNAFISYNPNTDMTEGATVIKNLPIPAYNDPIFVYGQTFGTGESEKVVRCIISHNGELCIYGTTVPTIVVIAFTISYPILPNIV